MKRTLVDVSVEDVEKRRVPSKHYVYVIYVTWSDGTVTVIYRRYSRFFELQNALLDRFPREGGSNNPQERVIPFLPGKILFGRSHIQKVALQRLLPINEYCKSLVRQPPHISESDLVLQFFESTPDDLHPITHSSSKKIKGDKISEPLLLEQYIAISDYQKEARNEITLQAGQSVEVVEKTETGWWFVHTDEDQGWAPSSYLEKQDGSQDRRLIRQSLPGQEEYYMCTDSYSPEFDDEIQLDKGAMVEVVERNLDGWWLVRCNGREGRAPATNLTRAATLQRDRLLGRQPAKAVERVPNLMSISNIHLQNFERSDPARVTLVSPASYREEKMKRKSAGDTSPFRRTFSDRLSMRPQIDVQMSRRAPPVGDLVNSPLEEDPGENEIEYQKSPPPRRGSIADDVPKKVKPPRPAPPKMQPKYIAVADFDDQAGDGIPLKQGQELQILQKTSTGWWYVRAGTEEGWAPASYIEEKSVPIQRSVKSCHQISTISSSSISSSNSKGEESQLSTSPSKSGNKETKMGSFISGLTSKLSQPFGAGKMKKSRSDSTDIQSKAKIIHILPQSDNDTKSFDENCGEYSDINDAEITNDSPVSHPVVANKNGFQKQLPELPLKKQTSGRNENVRPPKKLPELPSRVESFSDNDFDPDFEDYSPVYSETTENSDSQGRVVEYTNVEGAVHVSGTLYIAKESYDAADNAEISLVKGEVLEVSEKNDSGWWYVTTQDKEGWAPSGYLAPKVVAMPVSRSASTKSDRSSLPAPPPPPSKNKPSISELKAELETKTNAAEPVKKVSEEEKVEKKPFLPSKPGPVTSVENSSKIKTSKKSTVGLKVSTSATKNTNVKTTSGAKNNTKSQVTESKPSSPSKPKPKAAPKTMQPSTGLKQKCAAFESPSSGTTTKPQINKNLKPSPVKVAQGKSTSGHVGKSQNVQSLAKMFEK